MSMKQAQQMHQNPKKKGKKCNQIVSIRQRQNIIVTCFHVAEETTLPLVIDRDGMVPSAWYCNPPLVVGIQKSLQIMDLCPPGQ